MAGLYSGTFKQKKVIKLAPDAVVHINEQSLIEICPVCNSKLHLSDYITSISTNLANNTTIGTASFTISIPRHGHRGNYMVRGGRVYGLNLMDEVEIYIKSRFPNNLGNYQYHKVFWGVIKGIDESYGDGSQNISVECESILKWLQLMKTNEQPSVGVQNELKQYIDLKPALYASKTYADMNVYQIIHSLVNINFLNIVVPAALDVEKVIGDNDKEVTIGNISVKDVDLMKYWQKRFVRIKGSLRMLGTSPESFLKAEQSAKYKATLAVTGKKSSQVSASLNTISPIAINYNSKALMDFKPFLKPDDRKSMDIISSTYKNNLEIISQVKLFTGYEFYLDTNGELIFKPPFWNMDTSENTVYRIEESDIINWNFNESSDEVVTRVEVTGSVIQESQTDSNMNPRASFTNYELARQFGMKSEQISMRFFTTPEMCYYHAISEMDRINANRFRGSITILGRPELRLGYPVYIPSRDCYGYVENISHNFAFGSQFTTQIQLSAIRRKYIGNDPLASSFDKKGNELDANSRAFKVRGKPVIFLHREDLAFKSEFIEKLNTKEDIQKTKDKIIKANTQNEEISKKFTRDNKGPYKTNRAGVYEEVLLTDSRAQEFLDIAQKAKDNNNQEAYLNFLELALPISDEEGYELIGIFENGRSLKVSENNIIMKKAKSFSQILKNVLAKKASAEVVRDISPNISNVENIPNKVSGTLKGIELANERAEKEVEDFLQSKIQSLRDLSPAQTSFKKNCSCFEPGVTSDLKSKRTSKSNNLIKNKGKA